MRSTLRLCFLLLILSGCKHDDLTPDTYLKALSLGVEPLRGGVSLKWTPVFIFEEGMYGGPTPTNPAQYEIYLSESTEKELQKVAVIDGSIHEYILQNRPEGKTIYAQVKAIHPKLTTSESNIATTNTGQLGTSELLFPDNTPAITFGSWGGSTLLQADGSDTWTLRLADGNIRKLKSLGTAPVLSPDGRKIAFLGTVNSNTSYTTQLFVETIESGVVQLMDTQRAIYTVEWSNDGQWLAYSTGQELWKVLVVNKQRVLLNKGSGNTTQTQIDWSPDDAFIVSTQEKTGTPLNRYIVNLLRIPVDGSDPQPLLASNWRDEQPAFSPDGQRLAFISHRSGYPAIWVMDLKTGAIRQVTGNQEQFYYINRLDWMNNKQLTYTARLSSSVDLSLKKVTLP